MTRFRLAATMVGCHAQRRRLRRRIDPGRATRRKDAHMATPDEIRALIVEHVEAENARDPERVMATYSDDCIFEDVPRGRRHVGRAAILANYRELWVGFPGMVRRIDRMTIDDQSCLC